MLILLIDRGYLLSNPDTVTFWQLTSFSLVDYMVTGQYTGSSPFGHCLSDPALKSQVRSANGSCVYISMSLSSPLSLQPLQPILRLACRDACYYKPPSNFQHVFPYCQAPDWRRDFLCNWLWGYGNRRSLWPGSSG